jgi:hypothetical protein
MSGISSGRAKGDGMVEYKILTARGSKFRGTFDAEALEIALNSYAAEGWRVVEGFIAANLNKSSKAEILVILERPRD